MYSFGYHTFLAMGYAVSNLCLHINIVLHGNIQRTVQHTTRNCQNFKIKYVTVYVYDLYNTDYA